MRVVRSSRLSFDLRTPFYYESARVGDGTETTPARPRPTNTPRGCLSKVALAGGAPPRSAANRSRSPPPVSGACPSRRARDACRHHHTSVGRAKGSVRSYVRPGSRGGSATGAPEYRRAVRAGGLACPCPRKWGLLERVVVAPPPRTPAYQRVRGGANTSSERGLGARCEVLACVRARLEAVQLGSMRA